eukprot:CAMPEP_0194072582 /NCGR_PEP_ID=MMETSP0149-20130528/290_1 /TAXON_ID=122233 /ORGANISM="Chaetoceros debilis, Strain MM31A-1" /LENGTH=1273 /DNA_ID=CAMNT_0038752479 /DNA_START=363 /DNA_END=4187 /DNA_ORIENTATION=+
MTHINRDSPHTNNGTINSSSSSSHFRRNNNKSHNTIFHRDYHSSSHNQQAVRVNIGHGDGYYPQKNKTTAYTQADTPAQRKAARLELDQMTNSTHRILALTCDDLMNDNGNGNGSASSNSKGNNHMSLVNEIRVVLNYWSNRWVYIYHPYLAIFPTHVKYTIMDRGRNNVTSSSSSSYTKEEEQCGDYGPRQAERLLRWMRELESESQNDTLNLIERVMEIDGNVVLHNIIDAYLLPCVTNMSHKMRDSTFEHGVTASASASASAGESSPTSQGSQEGSDFIQFSSVTGNHNVNRSLWVPALYDAARAIDLMNDIHTSRNNTNVSVSGGGSSGSGGGLDRHGRNAILHTLAKLCILMANQKSYGKLIADNSVNIGWKAGIDDNSSLPTTCEMKSIDEVLSKMEELLQEMECESDPSFQPDIISYNHVIGTLARTNTGKGTEKSAGNRSCMEACDRAEWYLRRMELSEDLTDGTGDGGDDEDLLPTTAFADTTTYNLVLHTFSNMSKEQGNRHHVSRSNMRQSLEAAQRANDILERMEQRYLRSKREDVRPLTITYSTVLNAWANVGRAENAERLLKRFIALAEDAGSETDYVKPNLICFNSVISAWANKGGKESAENAMKIFQSMEELAVSDKENFKDIYPDTITYSSVISAFARSGRDDAGDRAMELLEQSIRLSNEEGMKELQPDSMTFNTVLDALSKQGQLEYSKSKGQMTERAIQSIQTKAENVFNLMKDMHQEGNKSVRPCTISYNILIDMYAKMSAPDKIEATLKEMDESYQAGNRVVRPCTITYNSLLYALANSNDKSGITKAMNLLKEMEGRGGKRRLPDDVRVDLYSIINVINALAKKAMFDKTAPKMIESVLSSMEQRYLDGETDLKPNAMCYNCCIDAWSKSGVDDAEENARRMLDRMSTMSEKLSAPELKPDTISYTSIITAISRRKHSDGPARAEAVFATMMEAGVKPNIYTYNNIINCWASSGRKDAAVNAEKILMQMQEESDKGNTEITPNAITFSTTISCWARQGDKGSGEGAERILDMIESINARGDTSIKSNQYTYGAVINAWSKSYGHSDTVMRAIGILDRMEEKYVNGNIHLRPNGPCYNAVINAIAKSSSKDKAFLAKSMLDRMKKSHENGNEDAKPDMRTYSTILNACAFTFIEDQAEKEEVLQIARQALKEILNGSDAPAFVFASFLLACSRLMGAGTKRDGVAQVLFNECRRRGVVDVKVILNLRKMASPECLRQILKGSRVPVGNIVLDDIPQEWRSNVKSRTPRFRR